MTGERRGRARGTRGRARRPIPWDWCSPPTNRRARRRARCWSSSRPSRGPVACAGRLEQRGCDVASGEDQWDRMRAGWPVIVGARGTALAPVPKVCGAVVVDADDESYRSVGGTDLGRRDDAARTVSPRRRAVVVHVERAVAVAVERRVLSLVGRRRGRLATRHDRRSTTERPARRRARPRGARRAPIAHWRATSRWPSWSSCSDSVTAGSWPAPSAGNSRVAQSCGQAEERASTAILACRERHELRAQLLSPLWRDESEATSKSA